MVDEAKYKKRIEQQYQMRKRAASKLEEKKKRLRADMIANPEKYRKEKKPRKPIISKQKTAKKLSKEYQSIFSENMHVCYMTGSETDISPHHIFGGPDKAFSEKYHFMLPLRSDWHTSTNYSIHMDRNFDIKMKLLCQRYWIDELKKTKEEWIEECRMWYLDKMYA